MAQKKMSTCAKIRQFVSANPDLTRSQLHERLEKKGFNPATIRTQVQLALKAAGRTTDRASDGPCAKVREICSAHPGAKRSTLQSLCEADGINPATARTQIQKFLAEQRPKDLLEAQLVAINELD